jgi:hypothetical protein
MKDLYIEEMPHFLAAIDAHREEDLRFCLPADMKEKLQ